ncbi:hypothetical protein B484DRAFT_408505 [Ochromonadaceae sp. CCMP2298]|nr:hypothetical protein B484DRAFT_408505 [Ochromonadaceae sp. CCMP2298]
MMKYTASCSPTGRCRSSTWQGLWSQADAGGLDRSFCTMAKSGGEKTVKIVRVGTQEMELIAAFKCASEGSVVNIVLLG